MTDDEGARLVGTGTFKVDRARALEKIRAYRSGSVGAVFMFIRAAAASGAKKLEVTEDAEWVTLRWDGAPLPPEFFEDPYGGLIGEDATDDAAQRWTALGLLHAFGPDVAEVTVESGPEGSRLLLDAKDLGEERQKPGLGSGGTLVRIWTRKECDRLWTHPFAEEARRAGVGLVWTTLILHFPYGRLTEGPSNRDERSDCGVEWESGPARLRLAVPERLDGEPSVAVYVAGVLAGFLAYDPGSPDARGWVDDPGLPLDASHVSFVAGEGSAARKAELTSGFDRLAAAACARLREDLPATIALLREGGWHLRLWQRRLRSDRVEEELETMFQYSRFDLKAAAARAVVDQAQLMLWLRRLAARRPDGAAGGPLDEAPVALGPGLEVLTLAMLRDAASRGLNYVRELGATTPAPAVWEDGAVPEFWAMLKGR